MLPALILCLAGLLGSNGVHAAAAPGVALAHPPRAASSTEGNIEAIKVEQCGQTQIKWDWPLNSQAGPNYIVEVIPAGNSTAPPIVGPVSVWSANWTSPALPIVHDATIQFRITGPDSKTIVSDPYLVEKCSRCDCELRDSRAAVAATPSITPVNAKRKGVPIAPLVGGIVGGVVGFAILALAIYLFCRRRRRAARRTQQVQNRMSRRSSQQASMMSTEHKGVSHLSSKRASRTSNNRASHMSSKHASMAASQHYDDNSASRSSRFLLPPAIEKRSSSQSLASTASASSRYSTQQMLILAMQKAEARQSATSQPSWSYTSDVPGGRGLADYRGPSRSHSHYDVAEGKETPIVDPVEQTLTRLTTSGSQIVASDPHSTTRSHQNNVTDPPAPAGIEHRGPQLGSFSGAQAESTQVDDAACRPSSERSSQSWHSASDPFETPALEATSTNVVKSESTVGMAL